jgi:DNA-binding FadR family transcriptional regulator
MLSSVRTPRVYEHIVAQLERAIFDGRLRIGDKLPPERQLVREFRASRVAVREALRALEHRGLVEVRQGSAGGHFICEADAAPLLRDFQTLLRVGRVSLPQLIEARLLVEPQVARLAALRATEIDQKTLRAALAERSALAAAGGDSRFLDLQFHRLVADTAKNPVHAMLTHALMALEVEVVPAADVFSADDLAAADTCHHEILDAIAARDADRAGEVMERHIVDVQRRLRRVERAQAAPAAPWRETR